MSESRDGFVPRGHRHGLVAFTLTAFLRQGHGLAACGGRTRLGPALAIRQPEEQHRSHACLVPRGDEDLLPALDGACTCARMSRSHTHTPTLRARSRRHTATRQ